LCVGVVGVDVVAAAFVLKAGAHTGTHEQRQGFRRRDAEQASAGLTFFRSAAARALGGGLGHRPLGGLLKLKPPLLHQRLEVLRRPARDDLRSKPIIAAKGCPTISSV